MSEPATSDVHADLPAVCVHANVSLLCIVRDQKNISAVLAFATILKIVFYETGTAVAVLTVPVPPALDKY